MPQQQTSAQLVPRHLLKGDTLQALCGQQKIARPVGICDGAAVLDAAARSARRRFGRSLTEHYHNQIS